MSDPVWRGLERGEHERVGAVFGMVGGMVRPRHYGEPAREYRSAVEGAAVVDRSFRGRLEVSGRAPVRMLDGILTGTVPAGPREIAPGVGSGRTAYSAVLTPKGRMVTDLRILRLDGTAEDGADAGADGSPRPPASPFAGPAAVPTGGAAARKERLLLDVPEAGLEGVKAYFGRFLPPRFAVVADVSDAAGLLTVLGPEAPALLSREALGLRVEAAELAGFAEGEYRVVDMGGGEAIHVVAQGDVDTPAWDLLADRATIRALWRRLLEAGAATAGHGVWETLRVERGRPAFGVDMDEETIPVEAGIDRRAIDHGKGCYTGQEVIVRIRDRGHVNRHLRGLRLGDHASPAAGTELFAPEARGERAAGVVTSSVHSPRRAETLALGYVRREVEPGTAVQVGGPGGPEAMVEALDEGGWVGSGERAPSGD
ncbi:MAG TPA: glycine cleavage T C-terminal barrel domain-containing protein, partial [Longimicrobiales bacterium]|nr:glycine cleavage T C-terminal barrel domain-containing protein [Longimicrobiales bacterium]